MWKRVLTATILCTIGVLCLSGHQNERLPEVKTVRAGCEDIYNSVSVSGKIEAEKTQKIILPQFADAIKIYVKRGETVKRGEPLFQIQLQSSVREDLSDRTEIITAECDGIVMKIPQKGEQLYPGLLCAEVADPAKLRIKAKVPELYISSIRIGQTANFHTNAEPDVLYQAKVAEIAPYAVSGIDIMGQGGNPTIETILRITDGSHKLHPGYSAEIKIFTDYRPYAVTVPYEAVMKENGEEFVYCIQGDQLEKKKVKTGYLLSNGIEIRNGLMAGEQIAIPGDHELIDGGKVTVYENK